MVCKGIHAKFWLVLVGDFRRITFLLSILSRSSNRGVQALDAGIFVNRKVKF